MNDHQLGPDGITKLTRLISSFFGHFSPSYFVKKSSTEKQLQLLAVRESLPQRSSEFNAAMLKLTDSSSNALGKHDLTEAGSPHNNLAICGNKMEFGIIGRAGCTESYQRVVKQQNSESIIAIAAEQLSGESNISEDPVDLDWAARFFRYAEDISDEEMQTIWGKILAGEIQQPNSFSYRTLELVRSLSKGEAEIFTKQAGRVVKFDSENSAILFPADDYKMKAFEASKLNEAGLISGLEAVSFRLDKLNESSLVMNLESFGYFIQLRGPFPRNAQIPFRLLTSAGNSLIKLIAPEPDVEYLEAIVRVARQKGGKATLSKIETRDENGKPSTARIILVDGEK